MTDELYFKQSSCLEKLEMARRSSGEPLLCELSALEDVRPLFLHKIAKSLEAIQFAVALQGILN